MTLKERQCSSSSAAAVSLAGLPLPGIRLNPRPRAQVLVEPIYLEDLARPNECTLELSVRVLPAAPTCFSLPTINPENTYPATLPFCGTCIPVPGSSSA